MRIADCRAAYMHAYTLLAVIYYITQRSNDTMTDQEIAMVEYHYQRIGEALGIRGEAK